MKLSDEELHDLVRFVACGHTLNAETAEEHECAGVRASRTLNRLLDEHAKMRRVVHHAHRFVDGDEDGAPLSEALAALEEDDG